MKNKIKKRTLGRRAPHRQAMLKNMTSSLLEHRSIVTTRAKAKGLVSFVEPLITRSKAGLALHERRYLLSKLVRGEDLPALLEVAHGSEDRRAGFLRLTKLPRRKGDGAEMVRVDVVDKDSND